jgi:aminoglycoside 6'-N-acetyltransferase
MLCLDVLSAKGPRMSLRPLASGFAWPPYSFRALARDDLAMITQWLHAREVVRWWGDPGEEFALIEGDLDGGAMAQWIVSLEGAPFAYAQAYEVQAWPQTHFAHLPLGAVAIDTFIGAPHFIGRGHGARFLRALAERLTEAGVPLVVIDPDVTNKRARRAYRKAGFRGEEIVPTESGSAVVMTFG